MATQNTPQLPALPVDESSAKYFVGKTFEFVDQISTLQDPQDRADVYEDVADHYYRLHMFGCSIAMDRKSIAACSSERRRRRLAELLVSLYGERELEEAEKLTETHGSRPWLERKRQAIARRQRKAELDQRYPPLAGIVGESPNILQVCEQIIQYAPRTLAVLITGDTGTGKEVVARALHACSPRRVRPFIAQNCAGIPDTLVESEFFGHERGAFTDAKQRRIGAFERADGGTLFLDEVGDLSPTAQAKLLRAIQEQEICRLGGTEPIAVDVRLIAATNKNLAEAMSNGRFRGDLYDRLCGVEIAVKPLEERLEDLQPLVKHFIEKHGLAPEGDPYSPYDIFRWVNDGYLDDGEQHQTLNSLLRERERLRRGGQPTAAVQPRRNVRNLEHAVRRAAATEQLRRYGDFPFVDVLRYRDTTAVGPTCYTPEQIADADIRIALALCPRPRQKAAAKLLGISEATLSRQKQRIGGRHGRSRP